MTVTPTRHRARAGTARLLATVAAVALATGFAAAAPAAAAPTPTPTPTESGVVEFTVAPVSNGIVAPGSGLTVSVELRNDTAEPTESTTISLRLGRSALPDRAALRAWLDDGAADMVFDDAAAEFVAPIDPGDDRVTALQVGPDDPLLSGRGAGVYPIAASYESDGVTTTAVSAMIVPDPGAGAPVVVAVPITAGPRTDAMLTSDELAELTGPTGALTHQLDAVVGTTAVLAVDPAIPAAIRVLGTSAPAAAVHWLERLLELPNERFALQFGDADPAVQVAAGLSRPQSPTTLQSFMDPADFATPQSTPTATPTPTPTPTEPAGPVLPTIDELLDVGATSENVYWPAADTATTDTVATLGAIAVDDTPSLTIVASTSTTGGATGATVGASARAGDAALAVYDDDVSRELSVAAATDLTIERRASLTAVSAYLSFATAESAGAPLLVAFDRAAVRSRVSLGAAISAAEEYPGVTPLGLAGLASASAAGVSLTDAAVDQARVDAASALFSDEESLTSFATILDDPTLITAPERAEILQVLGVGWSALPEAWAEAVADHRAASQTTLDSVGLLPISTINLVGSDGGLRPWVRNDLPWPVNLVLYATVDDLRLEVQDATTVVATAQSNTRVEVPVRAIGNGEVTVDFQLRSPAYVAIGDAETVDVNVRAEWEAFGTVALIVVVAALVVLGLVRTVLKLRARRRRLMDAATAATPQAPPGPEDAP